LDKLCSECQRRYLSNPLRVLDCKVETCKEATVDAPAVIEHLCTNCGEHFSQVKDYLARLKIPFVVNARMVRGLDYYVRTTFELVTDQLGSQNAVAAGGRYDGLVESLGGPALPGIGFAIGLERLVLMKGEQRATPGVPMLFIAAMGTEAIDRAFSLMSQLQVNGIRTEMDYQGKSLKAQMRRANKLNAVFTLILGAEEMASGQAQLKNMSNSTQELVTLDSLAEALTEKLGEAYTSA
jgi:histidyl-tRNA synthetase